MKLSEMKHILAASEIQLTKSLGQNFLHDANQLRRIVAAAQLTKRDKVLEVGPGLGPLTEALVREAGEVLAIEKDARLISILRERFKETQALHESQGKKIIMPGTDKKAVFWLLQDDALDYLRRQQHDWTEWKLVANLPYSVASPILVELAQAEHGPGLMVGTLQIEVAKRLLAAPGQKDYGVLTLLVQLGYQPLDWFRIPAGCFFPEPDIDSACVTLIRREQPLLPNNQREAFKKIVKRGFSQRRKMMLKLLKSDWPAEQLGQAFERLKLSPQARAETLSLNDFVRLTEILSA